MKVDELMIGDWVLFAGDKYQITKIDFEADYTFEPIPITEEILIKNGFERDEYDAVIVSVVTYNCGEALLIVQPKGGWKLMCGEMSEIQDVMFGDKRFASVPVSYIHELQHIFKQLKIKKEIVL